MRGAFPNLAMVKEKGQLAAREHWAREEGRQAGREEGREEGRQAGREDGKMEMILELLRKGQPLSFISEVSKYSIDKIAEIGRMNGLVVTK